MDARDIEKGDENKLAERAAQATIPVAQTVSAGAVADANLVYGIDYQMGDIVTTNVPVKWYQRNGDYYDPIETTIQVNQRITGVAITREGGTETIDLTFGDQPVTQSQTQQLKAEVAQLKAVEAPKYSAENPLPPEYGGARPTDVITGDANSVAFWRTVAPGYYFNHAGTLQNAPRGSEYGLVQVMRYLNDIQVLYYAMTDGAVHQMSINSNSTAVDWDFVVSTKHLGGYKMQKSWQTGVLGASPISGHPTGGWAVASTLIFSRRMATRIGGYAFILQTPKNRR